MVSSIRTVVARSGRNAGKPLGVLVLEDLTGRVEGLLFTNDFVKFRPILTPDSVVFEELPVPGTFPLSKEDRDVSYQYLNFSDGEHASEGRWASGPTPDGKGEFTYVATPPPGVPMPPPTQPDERLHGTTGKPSTLEKAKGAVKDALHKD